MRFANCHPDRKYFAKGFCSACYAKERRKDPVIRARHRASVKKWIKTHPEYERVRSRRRYVENPDYHNKLSASWKTKNRERVNKRRRQLNKENAEIYLPKMRADVKKRKALKRGAKISDFTLKQWAGMLEESNGLCYYCRQPYAKPTQEHKIPLSRGGDHTASNIVVSCMPCNNKKGIMTDKEFIDALAA